MTAAVSAATAVIYTPYVGSLIPLWNGSALVPTTFAEVSQAFSDTTKSPAAAVASTVYDLFGWLDGTTFRVTRGPAWTAGSTAGSTTARGTGTGSTALTRVNGLLVNQYAITNGPAAGYGTYLGTIATDASAATVSFNRGGAASGGTAAVVGLWNAYNRRPVGGTVSDTTANWTWNTASWRAANGGNVRLAYVAGLAEDVWGARYNGLTTASSTGNAGIGVGSNTTTAFSGTSVYVSTGVSFVPGMAECVQNGLLGQNFLAAIEYTNAGTMTGYGAAGSSPAFLQTGLTWTGMY